MDRGWRKALFAMLREASDLDDLLARFDDFTGQVCAAPPEARPYPGEVLDTLLGLGLRPGLAARLQRRYEDARTGLARTA